MTPLDQLTNEYQAMMAKMEDANEVIADIINRLYDCALSDFHDKVALRRMASTLVMVRDAMEYEQNYADKILDLYMDNGGEA